MMLNKSLRRIKNLVFKQKTTRISFEPMWFLDCETTEIKARGLPLKVEKALVNIKENGVAVLPGNISREGCDAIVRDFNNYIANSDDALKYRGEHGLHERLCNLQLISEASKRICFNKGIAEILMAAHFRASAGRGLDRRLALRCSPQSRQSLDSHLRGPRILG